MFDIHINFYSLSIIFIYFANIQGKWIYDLDPFEPLKYQGPLQSLKARVAAEGSKAVFSPLIERYILNNPHCVTVEMQVSLSLKFNFWSRLPPKSTIAT